MIPPLKSLVESHFSGALRRFLPPGSFKRNALTMIAGVVLAQGLVVLAAPVLTRLYTPDDFGICALFIAISAVMGVMVAWRYELAIMLPKEEEEAVSIVALSLTIIVGMAGLSLLGVAFFRGPIAELLDAPALSRWLWILPLSLLASGVYYTLIIWRSRRTEFKRLAVARISRSGAMATVQLAAGLISGAGPGGLVIGDVIGVVTAAGTLSWSGSAVGMKPWLRIKKDRMLASFVRYRKFAIFSGPAGIFSQGAQYLPFIFLGYFFGSVTVGYFFLAQRVLGLPLAVIGQALSHVFYQRLSKEKMERGTSYMLLVRAFAVFMIVGIIGAVVLFPLLPYLFSRIFGTDWSEAGHFGQLLIPMVVTSLAVSPISQTPLVYDPVNFTPRRGVMTRYAKKMVRPEFYGKISVQNYDGLVPA